MTSARELGLQAVERALADLASSQSLLPIVDWEPYDSEPPDDPDNWQDEADE